MTNIPLCGIHNIPMKLKPAGVSKAGKPYNAFWSCGIKNPDGTWCAYKPPKEVSVSPNKPAGFEAGLNKDIETAKWDKLGFGKCKTLYLVECFKRDMDLKLAEPLAELWATASMRVLPKTDGDEFSMEDINF